MSYPNKAPNAAPHRIITAFIMEHGMMFEASGMTSSMLHICVLIETRSTSKIPKIPIA